MAIGTNVAHKAFRLKSISKMIPLHTQGGADSQGWDVFGSPELFVKPSWRWGGVMKGHWVGTCGAVAGGDGLCSSSPTTSVLET